MKRLTFTIILAALGIQSWAQNNAIFIGGSGDGFGVATFQQADLVLNNSIFTSPSGDGASSSSFLQTPLLLNSPIFYGGSADGFSIFITPVAALPVTWLTFDATPANGKIVVRWETASELNNDRFEIQRSASTRFESIGTVKGNGTTTAVSKYEWIDRFPLSGTSYYRLKQIDYSGKYDYSHVIAIAQTEDTPLPVNIFPNPVAANYFTVVAEDNQEGFSMEFYDVKGHSIFRETFNANQKYSTCTLPSTLQPGVYFARFMIHQKEYTIKVILR